MAVKLFGHRLWKKIHSVPPLKTSLMCHFLDYLSWDVIVAMRMLLIFDIIKDNLTSYICFFLLSVLMKKKIVLYNVCDKIRWSSMLKCSAQLRNYSWVFSQIHDYNWVFAYMTSWYLLWYTTAINYFHRYSTAIEYLHTWPASICIGTLLPLGFTGTQLQSSICIHDQLVFALVLDCSRVFS